jgi:hypothetical protein
LVTSTLLTLPQSVSYNRTAAALLLLLQAELLAGSKLLLALCDRESSPRGRDEFFITDLVGLRALQQGSEQLLGIVTEVRLILVLYCTVCVCVWGLLCTVTFHAV